MPPRSSLFVRGTPTGQPTTFSSAPQFSPLFPFITVRRARWFEWVARPRRHERPSLFLSYPPPRPSPPPTTSPFVSFISSRPGPTTSIRLASPSSPPTLSAPPLHESPSFSPSSPVSLSHTWKLDLWETSTLQPCLSTSSYSCRATLCYFFQPLSSQPVSFSLLFAISTLRICTSRIMQVYSAESNVKGAAKRSDSGSVDSTFVPFRTRSIPALTVSTSLDRISKYP